MHYAASAFVFVVACSYTRPADVVDDGGHVVDMGSGSGSGSGSCTAKPAYGSVTFATGESSAFNVAAVGSTPHYTYWQGDLHDSSNIGSIQLTAGLDPFTGDPFTGTFALGADLNFKTCGVCVAVVTSGASPSGFISYYIATAGTLSVTAVPPASGSGQLTVDLSGATFVHVVTTNGEPTTTLDPSCTTSIDHMSFDVTAGAM